MKKLLQPGISPFSDKLSRFLAENDDDDVLEVSDELNQIVEATGLRIQHFIGFSDLDLAIFVLNNRKIIRRRLSSYPVLSGASALQLSNYELTGSGIHWAELDADISLRGLLLEETAKLAAL